MAPLTTFPASPSPSTIEGGGEAPSSPSGPSPTPAEELANFVAMASALFYLAEEGDNPGIQTYWDAFHYVSTSLSVGYANVFPVTQWGKVIGGVVMMVGPALSARALDDTRPDPTPALLSRLDDILAELKHLNANR